MGFVAAFDKSIFYNQENRYCIFQLKTADKMVPPEARSSFKHRDHLIRFVAVSYDLPRDDTVKMELEGTWTNDGKHGLRFEVVIPRISSSRSGSCSSTSSERSPNRSTMASAVFSPIHFSDLEAR